MCHDEWSGPRAPASLLRRILSSHRLDNASRDNADETVRSISTIHTFIYVYLRHSLSHFFFISCGSIVVYISVLGAIRPKHILEIFGSPETR